MIRLLMIFMSLFVSGQLLIAQNWVEEKNKGGIVIYCKESKEYRMKASKAVMYLDQPIEKIVAAVFNVEEYIKWMPDCAKSKILKRNNNNSIIYYGLYTAPWPATNRDLVMQLEKIKTTNGYKIKMTNKADYINTVDDAVRIPVYFGEWTFTNSDKGVKVEIEFQTDPGGTVPDWMIQGASVKSPYNMFESLKNYL